MRAPWQATPDGIEVRVRVTPRARRAAIGGLHAATERPAVLVAIREAPAEGAANDAVRRALAEALRCPPSSVVLRRGAASRDKTFAIAGDPALLAARLAGLAA